MTDETSKIVAGLRASADDALRYFQRGIAHSADAARRVARDAARATVRIRFWKDAGPHATPLAGTGAIDDPAGLDLAGLSSHIDQLTWHFADQERRLATLDAPAAPALDAPALEAELETVRARVRARRGRIAERTAGQTRSARNVEAKARRLEHRLDRLCRDRERLRELELAIASADAALIASQVERAEVGAQLSSTQRELASCAKESAWLQEQAATAAAARDLATERLHRIRAKLTALDADADGLRAHDLMGPTEAASRDAGLRGWLSQLRAAADQCAAGLPATPEAPNRGSSPSDGARALPPLDAGALRVPIERRLRMLHALAEIRIEETQAPPAVPAEDPARSHAAFARVSSAHVRMLLEEHERAWIHDALEAAGHEQGARLSHGDERAPDALREQLRGALMAWRRCDERLEEAAARARAAQLELSSLRKTIVPDLTRTDAALRQLNACIRERHATQRARARRAERAASKVRVMRQQQRALARKAEGARAALDRVVAGIEPAIAPVLGRLGTLEREVEAAAALVAGLRASHEQVMKGLNAAERELLEISRADAAPTDGADAGGKSSAEEPWTRARMEREIAALTDEMSRWKTRHARLEQRVEEQAGRLASMDDARHEDDTLAEFRLELEHARSVAHASLERALRVRSPAAHEPATPGTGDADPPPPSVPRPRGR